MREQILGEIRRLANTSGGRSPGRRVFERETGIRESEWRGIYWARWGDALTEAGLSPNEKQGRTDTDHLLESLAVAFRHYGRVPTWMDLRLYRTVDPTFPYHSTIANHFRTKAELLTALRTWLSVNDGYCDVAAMIPAELPGALPRQTDANVQEGFVYLVRSGTHFKIGRSEELERRIKEIRVALPETADLVHAIRTDDPAGIEAYWHRRFANRRANGEWFTLSPADVRAFKRRKYQ